MHTKQYPNLYIAFWAVKSTDFNKGDWWVTKQTSFDCKQSYLLVQGNFDKEVMALLGAFK